MATEHRPPEESDQCFDSALRRTRLYFQSWCSPEDVEDLAQSVALRLVRETRERFARSHETPQYSSSYVFSLARQVYLNWRRERLRKREPHDELLQEPSVNPSAEDAAFLYRALEDLPPKERMAVELFHIGGLGAREAAEELGVSVRTIQRQLRSARLRVAESAKAPPRLLSNRMEAPRSLAQTSHLPSELDPVLPRIVQACSEELMKWLAKHPDDLYRVHPGTFERIVAEIFEAEGFEVELLTSWNQADGGVDLLALHRSVGGTETRLAIQCKRSTARRRVDAEPIRALSGVLDRFRVHGGVVATTSYFTPSALEEAREHLWRVSLRDYQSIVTDLRRIGGYKLSKGGVWVAE